MPELDLAAVRARHTAALAALPATGDLTVDAWVASALDMPALLGRIAELDALAKRALDSYAALEKTAAEMDADYVELKADRDMWRERCDGKAWERTQQKITGLETENRTLVNLCNIATERLRVVEAERERWKDRAAKEAFERDHFEAMRPVVGAAKAWAADVEFVEQEHFNPLEWTLKVAVDNLQNTPASPPSPTVSAPQPGMVAQGTEGDGAQEGAQEAGEGSCAECHVPVRGLACPDCGARFCGEACSYDHRALGTCPKHADGVLAGDPEPETETDQPEEAPDLTVKAHNITDLIDARLGNVTKPAPADPAGLDEAIEAAAQAIYASVNNGFGDRPWQEIAEEVRYLRRKDARLAIAAAAPHIRRAVLLEAADELDAASMPPGHIGMCNSAWLRERAEREVAS